MITMTHASVFSGIGGPEVAAAMLGWENLFHCEINPFGRAVLEYWFPNAKSYEDITKTDFSEWRGKVNVLTGGFPCQPFSYAGQRRGEKDDRYLWPYMHQCINQVRPDWVVCENVGGITTMVEQGSVTDMAVEKSLFDEGDTLYRYRLEATFTLERICEDLEHDGYAVQAVIIPACAVNAPHRRDRVFIIGHRNDAENPMCSGQLHGQHGVAGCERDIRDTCTGNCERLCREASGSDITDATLMHLNGGITGDGCNDRRQPQSEFGSRDCTTTERGITANADCDGLRACGSGGRERAKMDAGRTDKPLDGTERPCTARATPDAACKGLQRRHDSDKTGHREGEAGCPGFACEVHGGERYVTGSDGLLYRKTCIAGLGRWDAFPTQSPVCRGNDGIPYGLDNLTISPSKWRTESLKAYGNAIVPQVMYEIFRAIELTYQ